MDMEIKKTSEYEIFSFLGGNRQPNEVHLQRLIRAFKQKYLISPISVNEKMEIIDGQHRFLAAQELGLPVYYFVVDGYGLNEVHILNTNNVVWKKQDYMDGYCDLGYPEYLKMRGFMEEFPTLGFKACEILLTNNSGGASNTATFTAGATRGRIRSFEDGALKIPDISLSRKHAKQILEIGTIYDGYNRSVFVAAMVQIFNHTEYEHSVFMKRLRANPSSLVHCANAVQYRDLVEDIYNFRSRNPVNLRILQPIMAGFARKSE